MPAERFLDAYVESVATVQKPPMRRRERRELLARAAPPDKAIALKGCVITPEKRIDGGHVVMEGGLIRTVQKAKPSDARVIDTGGVIAPGLIDLHGHPEYNVFAAWEPPKQFVNRYAWRRSKLYHQLIRDPQDQRLNTLPPWTQLRYAEIRALVGGVVAIQGSGEQATQYQDEALVRNVDKWIFGGQVGRSMVDLPSAGRGMDQFNSIMKDIKAGTVKAFYIHLAEGKSNNKVSTDELGTLDGLGGLLPQTVIIHGTALSEAQLDRVHAVGAKLVWSPQSNLRLYGETTRAAYARSIGIPVGLGADWLPSGSTSLLAEMKVARRCLAQQSGSDPGGAAMVDMVTRGAAAIAGLESQLGQLAVDRPADVAVFERVHDDPWESIAQAEPAQVDLVMIGGDVAYGRADLVEAVVGKDLAAGYEPQLAWGKPMLLDNSYVAHPGAQRMPKLGELRAALINAYPQVGPIYA
jgi:cytosine/adenosine deaminase-related metal-dependent hydrolase